MDTTKWFKYFRISVPLGIIGIIYESRPNVTIDAGSLCIKSGNTQYLEVDLTRLILLKY